MWASPSWVRLRLHIFDSTVDRHRNGNVQQGWRRCHRMTIVLVIDFNVRVRRLTFPIRHELEWTGLCAGLGLHRVFQDIDVEIWRRWILLGLATKDKRECWHVELESSAHIWWLEFLTNNEENETISAVKIRYKTYTLISCLFGKIFSRFWTFLMRKQSLAGFGLLASTLTIPAGKDSIMSPEIFTWHLDSSLPLKSHRLVSFGINKNIFSELTWRTRE